MRFWKTLGAAALALLLLLSLAPTAYAEKAGFEYKLTLTDQNGRELKNPRTLGAGDKLSVEIELRRTDTDAASYETYGVEFRLSTLGLSYNGDGSSFQSETPITKQVFDSGDSVGFAYYDMERVGVRIGNPAMVGKWTYTVSDPGAVNITVPVALLYITGGSESYAPVGNARLILDPNGGTIKGKDVSGEYPSGTVVTLPDASFGDYVFKGWSLGPRSFRAGESYTVTGVTTLVAQWEGLTRNRQVLFEPNGGGIPGADPSGMYADGERITVPKAERDGFTLSGWQMGGRSYAPGESWTVDNSVVFVAQWTKLPTGAGALVHRVLSALARAAVIGLYGLLPLLLGWWLILLLWRRCVRYSLLDGGVKLSYRDRRYDSVVKVYLTDDDDHERLLGVSDTVPAGEKLKLINGRYVVLGVDKGYYKGRLHVAYPYDDKEPRDIKVRIHAKKKEYNEDER